jgi:hypothetical protein
VERPRPSKRPRPAHLSIRGRKRGRGAVRAPPMHGFMQIKQGRTTPHCPTGNGKERRRRRRPVVAAVALVSAAASSSRLASRGASTGTGTGGVSQDRARAEARPADGGAARGKVCVLIDRWLAGCCCCCIFLSFRVTTTVHVASNRSGRVFVGRSISISPRKASEAIDQATFGFGTTYVVTTVPAGSLTLAT